MNLPLCMDLRCSSGNGLRQVHRLMTQLILIHLCCQAFQVICQCLNLECFKMQAIGAIP